MQIKYERLNQIIEEEVSRFKRISEQLSGIGGGVQATPDSLDAKKIKAKAAIDRATTPEEIIMAVQEALKGS